MQFTSENLGAILKGGYATPHCTHDHSELWLHAKCHPQANASAVLVDGQRGPHLEIRCSECGEHVLTLAPTE